MSLCVGSSGVKYRNVYRQNVFFIMKHSKKHVQVEMHRIMMLHANYTVLYIKVQCHNGSMNLLFRIYLTLDYYRSFAALCTGHA